MKTIDNLSYLFTIQHVRNRNFDRHFIAPPQSVIGGKAVALSAFQSIKLIGQGGQGIAAVNHNARRIFVQIGLGGFVDDWFDCSVAAQCCISPAGIRTINLVGRAV
ncbi:hypothetical protein D3C84_1067980 [compost metagenome]